MTIDGRNIQTIVGAVRQHRHYTSLAHMFRVYRSPTLALVGLLINGLSHVVAAGRLRLTNTSASGSTRAAPAAG